MLEAILNIVISEVLGLVQPAKYNEQSFSINTSRKMLTLEANNKARVGSTALSSTKREELALISPWILPNALPSSLRLRFPILTVGSLNCAESLINPSLP